MLGILEADPKLEYVKQQATLIEATEAAHWFFEESERDEHDIFKDLHRLTAPGKLTWIEFSAPPSLHKLAMERLGALVFCAQIDNKERPDATKNVYLEKSLTLLLDVQDREDWFSEVVNRFDFRANREKLISSGHVPQFVLGLRVFTKTPSGTFPSIIAGMYLDETGKALTDHFVHIYPVSITDQLKAAGKRLGMALSDDQVEHGARVISYNHGAVFLFILSLMNCRNVTLSEPEPIHHQRSERRRMERAGQEPVPYRWLRIKQLQKKVDEDAEALGKTGKKRRLHQVRSHWAHYDAEAPLFGRPGLSGTFFRPQSLRGRSELGEIHKGYKPIPDKSTSK